MSEYEDGPSEKDYNIPVPELDDHRHHGSSAHRLDTRPRRGTFDTLYGAQRLEADAPTSSEHHASGVRVRDFEEAIVDGDAGDVSPVARRSRRPTVDTVEQPRDLSPPNSVKAFAEARRRERDLSFSEQRLPGQMMVCRHG